MKEILQMENLTAMGNMNIKMVDMKENGRMGKGKVKENFFIKMEACNKILQSQYSYEGAWKNDVQ